MSIYLDASFLIPTLIEVQSSAAVNAYLVAAEGEGAVGAREITAAGEVGGNGRHRDVRRQIVPHAEFVADDTPPTPTARTPTALTSMRPTRSTATLAMQTARMLTARTAMRPTRSTATPAMQTARMPTEPIPDSGRCARAAQR